MSVPEAVLTAWPLILFAFLAGGMVRAMLGIGLPVVAVPLMLLQLDLPTAIGVVMIPSFLSNLIMVLRAGRAWATLKAYAHVILPIFPAMLGGVWMLINASPASAILTLGVLTSLYVAMELLRLRPRVPQGQAVPWGMAAGGAAGFFGGFTGVISPPLTVYLLALGLDHKDYIAAAGIIFLASVCFFYPILFAREIVGFNLVAVSALAMLPTYLGIEIGQWLRQRLPETLMRWGLLLALGLIGLNLVRRGSLELFF